MAQMVMKMSIIICNIRLMDDEEEGLWKSRIFEVMFWWEMEMLLFVWGQRTLVGAEVVIFDGFVENNQFLMEFEVMFLMIIGTNVKDMILAIEINSVAKTEHLS
jgi:hypothetical protein